MPEEVTGRIHEGGARWRPREPRRLRRTITEAKHHRSEASFSGSASGTMRNMNSVRKVAELVASTPGGHRPTRD
jgi:hypothetical protein